MNKISTKELDFIDKSRYRRTFFLINTLAISVISFACIAIFFLLLNLVDKAMPFMVEYSWISIILISGIWVSVIVWCISKVRPQETCETSKSDTEIDCSAILMVEPLKFSEYLRDIGWEYIDDGPESSVGCMTYGKQFGTTHYELNLPVDKEMMPALTGEFHSILEEIAECEGRTVKNLMADYEIYRIVTSK